MAKQTDGRLRLQLDCCLFDLFLCRNMRLTVNGFVKCFVEEGDSNVIETDLFVARRTETRSRPTKRKIRSRQRHIHTILRTTLLNTIRNCSNSINLRTIFTPNNIKNPLVLKK